MGGSALLDMGTPLTSLKHNNVMLKDGICHISDTQNLISAYLVIFNIKILVCIYSNLGDKLGGWGQGPWMS